MASTKVTIVPPIYKRILSRFPQNFTFCFAYGSAVKKQLQNKPSENLIDLIFCVNNPNAWHEANLKHNFSHYSALKYFGHNFISQFQQNFGAKVYFNTLVPLDDDIWIKYGVISTEDLITDLLEWSDLYLAGRLHKPVEIIKKPLNTELDTALQLNLQSAVHAALLILPDSFTEYQFYHTVSYLSYGGDFRMTFGENKSKVENIVKPQLLGFRQLYRPFILSLPDYVEFPMFKDEIVKDQISSPNTVITKVLDLHAPQAYCSQDVSPIAKLHHLNQLPRWPQKALTRFWNRGTLRQDTEDVLRAIAYDPDCGLIVKQCISDIVWKSSVSQSLKSIITAGLLKSVKYSSRKIKKINMYRLSDSDSVDSDKGIRYKTDSIRNKSNSSETDSQSSRRDSKHHSEKRKKRSRSRSPYHRDHSKNRKTKKRKRKHSSEDEDDQRNYSRISGKKNTRRSSEYSIGDKDSKGSGSKQEEKRSGGQYVEEPLKKLASNATFGPTLPPRVSETLVKAEPPLAADQNQIIGPSLPPHLKKQESNSVMGPALPPHLIRNFSSVSQSSSIEPTQIVLEEKLLEKNLDSSTFGPTNKPENKPIGPTLSLELTDIDPNESSDSMPLVIDDSENRVIGPSLPPHLKQILLEESLTSQADTLEVEELEEVYGPLPVGETYSRSHMELEERALKLKIDQLEPPEDKQPIREEWMLTLPEGKSAKFGLGPRQFKAKAGPDLSDRSSWTDTPEDKARKKATGVEVEPKVDLKREAELKEIHRRDEEQEAVAKKSKKHKDSLLEMHQKKIKEEKKNEAGPSERRPFSREIDLQVNRFDEAQKKAVLKKAQLLDNRFSTGESKYL